MICGLFQQALCKGIGRQIAARFAFHAYGLGENTDDPGSKLVTRTSVADGFIWIVSWTDAGFFLVAAAKAVSKGMLLLINMPVRKLNSSRVSCSLFSILRNRPPESIAEI